MLERVRVPWMRDHGTSFCNVRRHLQPDGFGCARTQRKRGAAEGTGLREILCAPEIVEFMPDTLQLYSPPPPPPRPSMPYGVFGDTALMRWSGWALLARCSCCRRIDGVHIFRFSTLVINNAQASPATRLSIRFFCTFVLVLCDTPLGGSGRHGSDADKSRWVGGRRRAFVCAWKEMCAAVHIMTVIEFGTGNESNSKSGRL